MKRIRRSNRYAQRKQTLFCLCFLMACSLNSIALGCPTCKNDLQHSGSEFGFAASILLMMTVPFCIFAGWAVVIFRLRRQMKLDELTIEGDASHLSEINEEPQTALS